MEETKNPIQSAERIFQVLETVALAGTIGLMDLSSRLNLHKSTVHRMLLSLTCMNYVTQDENGKYRLTYKIVEISSKVLSNIDETSIAHPYLEQLANACGETVHFVQRIEHQVTYIDKVNPLVRKESSIQMASQIGLVRPMYCSGVGKAILAELSTAEVEHVWNQSMIEKKTPYTIMTIEDLKRELSHIQEVGYALDNEENELGVRCIAASVVDYQGRTKYAFSISAPATRMVDERIKELSVWMLEVKEKLAHAFGS